MVSLTAPNLNIKLSLGLSNRDISGANEFNRNTPRYILDAVIMWNFAGKLGTLGWTN